MYRIILGILGFCYVKYNVIKRAVEDAINGDIWWCVLGIGCLILPSIPTALKYLQKRITIVQNKNSTLRVKEFLILLFFTLFYVFGGFFIFALYQWLLKLYCTVQNIKNPTGEGNNQKYREKETEMNLHQVALESAPDGLLTVKKKTLQNSILT